MVFVHTEQKVAECERVSTMEEKNSGEEERSNLLLLDRASRATRGKRLSKLLDDEVQQDELFWGQDALKEEDEDDNYQEEAEIADEFDSDFDQDEPEPDEEQPQNDDERMNKKKRLVYPGKATLAKKKKKKKILSNLDDPPKIDDNDDGDDDKNNKNNNQDDDAKEVMIRKSTRTSVIVRQAEREAIREALKATYKPVIRKKGEEKKMSQEEMLLEAAQTEIMNLRNLERVLAREEEVKRRAIVHKTVFNGPQIHYISQNGCSYLEFTKGASFHSDIATTSQEYPEQPVCVITGLPAKYRDPKTGLPYATKEAFKIIRQRILDESANSRKETNMGGLYDSVSGYGFPTKKKRSTMRDKNIHPHDRSLARFRRIPTFEDEDSD